ncbi:MAG: NADH-quinone oxidoreductase subunit J [Campylobacteraceae bacterium]|jgi:NADH-quinone oxidoreductase subunit J|nr:NADH-quinone oxidoreductase subunit J [Campylobacteraceae bacterium]
MFEQIAFYTFAGLTAAMFLITVTTKNILYAMSALAAGMIFISGFFFILNADFLGVVQIVVYAGAVMALYAFGMMFFDSAKEVKENIKNPKKVFIFSAMAAVLIVLMVSAPVMLGKPDASMQLVENMQNPGAVGVILFTKYLIPFELASLMLLIAMIAGIVLAGKKMDLSLTTEDENANMEMFKEFRLSSKSGEHK